MIKEIGIVVSVLIVLAVGLTIGLDSARNYAVMRYPEPSIVSRFTFEEHSYIRFGVEENQSIVHDPRCQCQMKKGGK